MDGERERMGRRPGRPLATLLGAGAVSNLGDGVTVAAAPLLAASITRDPRAIAAVGVAWSLPWLLFALVSGAVADRTDRRFGVSALLLATLPGRPPGGPAGHRVLHTICWVLAIENIVEMAGFAMLVLLAQDGLGLDARGYGLLPACLAVGGVVGGTVAARLHRRLGDQGSVVGSIC